MVPARRARLIRLRVPLVLAVFMAAAALAVAALHSPAAAQEQGWSLRNLLFPRRSERVYPPPPRIEQPRPKKKVRTAPAKAAEPRAPVVEKAPEARTVLVVGDFMAGGLAEGLDEMFAAVGVKVAPALEASNTLALIGLVRAGLGVTLYPERLKSILGEGLTVRPLSDPRFRVEIILVWKRTNRTVSVRSFADIVRRIAHDADSG